MNERQYLLVKLIEECAEVSQRATKALTFGLYEKQSDGPSTNTRPEVNLNNNERLAQEFTDLIAVSEMLNEHIAMPLTTANAPAKCAKKEKIRKYMSYSRKCGTLDAAITSSSSAGSPPVCIEHNEPMALYFNLYPTGPSRSGWACQSCLAEPVTEPEHD